MARFSGRAAFGALSARTNGEILVSNRTLSIHQSVDESIISRECILEKRYSSLISIFLRTKLLSLRKLNYSSSIPCIVKHVSLLSF